MFQLSIDDSSDVISIPLPMRINSGLPPASAGDYEDDEVELFANDPPVLRCSTPPPSSNPDGGTISVIDENGSEYSFFFTDFNVFPDCQDVAQDGDESCDAADHNESDSESAAAFPQLITFHKQHRLKKSVSAGGSCILKRSHCGEGLRSRVQASQLRLLRGVFKRLCAELHITCDSTIRFSFDEVAAAMDLFPYCMLLSAASVQTPEEVMDAVLMRQSATVFSRTEVRCEHLQRSSDRGSQRTSRGDRLLRLYKWFLVAFPQELAAQLEGTALKCSSVVSTFYELDIGSATRLWGTIYSDIVQEAFRLAAHSIPDLFDKLVHSCQQTLMRLCPAEAPAPIDSAALIQRLAAVSPLRCVSCSSNELRLSITHAASECYRAILCQNPEGITVDSVYESILLAQTITELISEREIAGIYGYALVGMGNSDSNIFPSLHVLAFVDVAGFTHSRARTVFAPLLASTHLAAVHEVFDILEGILLSVDSFANTSIPSLGSQVVFSPSTSRANSRCSSVSSTPRHASPRSGMNVARGRWSGAAPTTPRTVLLRSRSLSNSFASNIVTPHYSQERRDSDSVKQGIKLQLARMIDILAVIKNDLFKNEESNSLTHS